MTQPTSLPTALSIRGPLDGTAVDHLRRRLPPAAAGAELVVHCHAVSAVDPVGAARLWLLCREAERNAGLTCRLVGLPDRLARRLRHHPLNRYLAGEDDLFRDPFASGPDSRR